MAWGVLPNPSKINIPRNGQNSTQRGPGSETWIHGPDRLEFLFKRQRLNTTEDLERRFNNLALAILGHVGWKVWQSVGGPSVGSQSETILQLFVRHFDQS